MKLDFQKVWQGILIRYSPDIIKYFCIWALQTKQVIITSEPYINESKQGAKLLEKWLVKTSLKSKVPAGEPRPRVCPRTCPIEEFDLKPIAPLKENDNIETIAGNEYEMVMSITESSSMIHELAIYKEATSNLIHGR